MTLVLILGLLMNAVALPLAGKRVWFLWRVISSGQPAPDRIEGVTGRLGAAVKRQVVEVFGQKKLLKWSVPGAAHFFVFWAFLILATVYLEAYGSLFKLLFTGGSGEMDWAIPLVGNWALLGFAQDFIAMMALFGLLTFVWIRLKNAPKDLGRRSRFFGSHLSGAWITLFMIFNVIWTMFLFRGASSALGNLPYTNGAFISIGVGKAIDGLSEHALEVIEGIGLLLHIGIMLVFLIFVLNSKHLHIFVAPLNVLFGRQPVALGAAKPMMSGGKALTLDDLEDLDEDAKLGIGASEDFSWKGILDMTTCTECGRCQDQCPAWNTEKPLSPKLMIMALRDHTLSKAPYLLADESKRESMLANDPALAKEVERPLIGPTGDEWFYMPDDGSAVIDPDVLWSCVTCGACVQQCPVDIEHVDHIVDMRRYQVLVESNFPAELNGLFKGMENKGNPWNMSPTARMDWAKDLPFEVKLVGKDIESLDEVDWLFWVGCAGAYEDRAKKTTRAVAELLDMAGVSFGVLGNGETCTGDSARRAGNEFVFQGLAAQNVETFKEYKVKKAVTTCAHCFNTLKNEYRELGVELEVVHHTQLLNQLVREKKLTPVASSNAGPKRSITYHDPCYIGRHNQVYAPPRELLSVIPDAELTEMPRNSERSFCCGAGGARMWMEETLGSRINETRTAEAVATGADQIAVGCPFCRVMLSDGLTSAQSKGDAREEVEVLDVAQMLLASIKGESTTGKKAASTADSASAHGAAAAGAATATATATDERDATDVATKAEPEAGDVTQTEETVTRTEDVGPAAKASGGSSLFDLGDDASEPASSGSSLFDLGDDASEPTPESEATAEPEPASSGGSLFDLGDDSSEPETTPETPPETKAETKAEPEPSSSGSTVTPATEIPEGGSLFDIETPTEEPAPAASDPSTPADHDAAADSTTDGDTDRSNDAADTDVAPPADTKAETATEPETQAAKPSSSGSTVTPATEIPEGGSLFDIETPTEEPAPAASDPSTPADHDAAADSTTDGDTDRSNDAADTDVAPPADTKAETATEPETQAATPSSSGSTVTPATEIPEGGSLFDIETPTEEPAPAASDPSTPADHDAAADSTTDGDTDRSNDAADTDVAPPADTTTEPDTEQSAPDDADEPVTSLRDIKAKYAEGGATDAAPTAESGQDAEPDTQQDSPADEGQVDDGQAKDGQADEEPRPTTKPTSSGEAHQPRTDAEIGEGGSLFDL